MMLVWQARWVARVLSGRVSLPSRAAMEADTEAFYDHMRRTGTPVRYTHCQAGSWMLLTAGIPGGPCSPS